MSLAAIVSLTLTTVIAVPDAAITMTKVVAVVAAAIALQTIWAGKIFVIIEKNQR